MIFYSNIKNLNTHNTHNTIKSIECKINNNRLKNQTKLIQFYNRKIKHQKIVLHWIGEKFETCFWIKVNLLMLKNVELAFPPWSNVKKSLKSIRKTWLEQARTTCIVYSMSNSQNKFKLILPHSTNLLN